MSCRPKWHALALLFAKGVTLLTVSSIPLLGGTAILCQLIVSHVDIQRNDPKTYEKIGCAFKSNLPSVRLPHK